MVNQNQQLTINNLNVPTNFNELSQSLIALKPDNSETTKIITYALVATAIVGIFVYQYIKNSER